MMNCCSRNWAAAGGELLELELDELEPELELELLDELELDEASTNCWTKRCSTSRTGR